MALAAAITDASQVAGLEQFERWNSLTPLPLDRIASWCAAPSSEAP